jgi:hypothetical protein
MIVRAVVATGVVAAVLMLNASGPAAQQAEFTNNFKYNSGQGVQPVFEGWSRVPDGSFNMHFGYLNRNYVEQPSIPVGANNNIQPDGPDRGQPTFFYTRTQRNLFSLNVPKEWDPKREVIWTITVNGKTERAVGWLQAEWEIDPVGGAGAGGGDTDPERIANKAPSITIAPVPSIALPATASLVASVTDDGLPKPRPRVKPAVGQETPPTLQGGIDAPVNVPAVAARSQRETPPGATAAEGSAPRSGLSVSWITWRGPADVTFSPRSAPATAGTTTTTATFQKPGEYVLRATVTDTFKTAVSDVKVTVR